MAGLPREGTCFRICTSGAEFVDDIRPFEYDLFPGVILFFTTSERIAFSGLGSALHRLCNSSFSHRGDNGFCR
jgi:hypothetical protein